MEILNESFFFISGSDCPVLGTPISGRKYGSKYNNRDIVTFECDPGFVLKGSAVRKCLQNGTWNGTDAICRGKFLSRYLRAVIMKYEALYKD